jgi:C1A family cysteine protease
MLKSDRKYHTSISRLPVNKLSFKYVPRVSAAPDTVDLRPQMPPVYNQGALGSCTANALVAGFQYKDMDFMGSRLFLYYNERCIENDVQEDAGAQLYDGIKSLLDSGVCSEQSWAYDISKFAQKPPPECYVEAEKHQALECHNIPQDLESMKHSLFQGVPFVVGIQLFEEFETEEVAKTGIVPFPTDQSVSIGGHAVLCVGYTPEHWIMRNSWGKEWGDAGYFYLPHDYLLNDFLSSDLWNIMKVEEP